MQRSRFSEEQIIAILTQHESGVSTADVCREQRISSAIFAGTDPPNEWWTVGP